MLFGDSERLICRTIKKHSQVWILVAVVRAVAHANSEVSIKTY